MGCTLCAVFSLFAADAPAVPMPVPALINGAATAHRVAFLPHHQMRRSGRNRAVAFGAGVGFLGVDGGNVLHQPVTVSVTFQPGCRVEDPADITPCGCLTVPLIAGGAGYSPAGMILTCHEPYSTAPLSYLYLPALPLFALRSSSRCALLCPVFFFLPRVLLCPALFLALRRHSPALCRAPPTVPRTATYTKYGFPSSYPHLLEPSTHTC